MAADAGRTRIQFRSLCRVGLNLPRAGNYARTPLSGILGTDYASRRHANPFESRLDSESLGDGLALRVRRRGDVFQPLGLQGHSQRLSDFFVNEKLPARARDRWPLALRRRLDCLDSGVQAG